MHAAAHMDQRKKETSPSAAEALDSNAAARSVRLEQVRLLYSHLPTSQLVELLNGAILAFVQTNAIAATQAAAWFAMLVVATLGRLLIAFLFARAEPSADQVPRWQHLFLAGATVSGIVWGASAWLLYPADSVIHQVFIAFVLGGMVAGSVTVLAPVFSVFVVFALTALLPIGLRYLVTGDQVHLAMAGMTGIFGIAIVVVGKRIHRTIRDSLQFRFENLAMIDDLVNARIYVESVNADLLATQQALKQSNEELETRVADRTKALRAMDRRKDEFLAVLSHELRNPLAPIRNSIYILGHVDPASPQALQAREVIERQTYYVTRLVDDLLDVTRIARGKIELRRERTDLTGLVRRTGEDHTSTFSDLGITFSIETPPTAMWADVDPTRVAQLIGNLLHNAANFTPTGAQVRLSLLAVSGYAEIEVADSGAGIEPDLLPILFEPFAQGSRSLARTEGGLGLGLALVKGISELHGGTVSASSAGPGKGAAFVVRLPLASESAVEKAPDTTTPRSAINRRILVVDDNRDAADSLASLVGFLGHWTEVAYDGTSALAKARSNAFDIVLCDLGLPDIVGYDLARMLRAERGGLKLIAVSGYAQPEDVTRAKSSGFDAHLAKPVDIESLERLIA